MKVKKILVVEDEEVIRRVLRLTLNKWGFEVEEAGDGVSALQKLGKETYALIICDIVMPNMDGWELIKRVKGNPETESIPIIALTGKNKDSDMFEGYNLGVNYYMTKPFTKAQLQYGIQLIFEEGSTITKDIDLSSQFDGEES